MPEEIRTGTRSSRIIFKYARDNSVKNIKFKDYILYFGHQIQRPSWNITPRMESIAVKATREAIYFAMNKKVIEAWRI